MGTVIIAGVLCLIVIGIIVKLIHDKKSGKGCSGCPSSGSCPSAKACHGSRNNNENSQKTDCGCKK